MLLEQDGHSLTLEAVAQRAGVSKGGLTHHFPNKEILIEAAYARMIEQVNEKVERLSGGRALGTPQEMRAYIAASLEQPFRGIGAELGAGVVSLLGEDRVKNDRLLDPLRRLYAARLKAFRSSRDASRFARSTVVFLAVESLLFMDIFRLCDFSEEEMAEIESELFGLALDPGPVRG
jgi:AcrR family transcriptional regulator